MNRIQAPNRTEAPCRSILAKSRSVRQEKEGDRLEQCNVPVTLSC